MMEALKKAAVKSIYTEYPNVRYNSWTGAYGDDRLWAWLFARKHKSAETKKSTVH